MERSETRRKGRLYIALWMTTLAACGSATSGPASRFLAVIEADNEGVISTVPGQATANESFDVTIVTHNNRGCEELGPTEVVVIGLVATVTPFDQSNGHPNCVDQYQKVVHVAGVRFATRGIGTIVFRGLSDVVQDTIEVNRTIVIQ